MSDIFGVPLSPQPPAGKHIFVADLKPKDVVRTTFLVKSKQLMEAKNGKPYLALVLQDKSGAIDTRVWEGAAEMAETFREGDVVAVAGKTHLFQNRMQLVLEHLIRVPEESYSIGDYLPAADVDLDKLYSELRGVFSKLECPWTRQLSMSLLDDPEIAPRYKLCPAAKAIHHAFLGGLLVHSLQLIKLAEAVLPLYEDINRSIVLFGCAFHDFGKIFELSYDSAFGYTDEGRLVGHITIGATIVDRKIREIPGFPKDLDYQLKHIILAHHGKLEYGSPKRPHTIEAQLVHHLDDMDSKINSIQTFMKAEKNTVRWTGHHRAYDQYYYKPDTYLGG